MKKIPEKPVKESLDPTKINWADYVMADDSDSNEINLEDFDLDSDELVAKAAAKIKKEKTLTGLAYINTALNELGYEIDNPNPFFFTSIVHVSDRELAGFLYVNRDGFYSNCMEESEMQLILSWDSVKDIELVEENESSIKISLIAVEGTLIISEPYSKSMIVLLSIYKNSWEKVLKGEIDIITFDTHTEYLNWLSENN